jgi:hypothetical protein
MNSSIRLLRERNLRVWLYRHDSRLLIFRICFVFGGRKLAFPSHLYPSDLPLSAIDIALLDCTIVEVQAAKRQADANGLHGMYMLGEPDDGCANDGNALDKGGDAVRDRGSACQDNKSKDVLEEMDGAIGNEVGDDARMVRPRMGWMRDMSGRRQKSWKIGPCPDWDHEQKGHTGRVKKEIQLVKLM